MSRLDPISILWDNYLEMNPGIYKIFKSLSQREREVDQKANIRIEVGSNEAVYIYHLFTTPNMYDDLILSSSSSTAIYNELNTLRIEWGETGSGNNSQNFRSYSSGLISKHFSDVLIDIPHRHNGPPGGRFVIRYVRVNYSPRKKKKK